MIISHPGYKTRHGTTCESITELIDLYPTLTDLCGLPGEQPEILQGKTLAGYIMSKNPLEDETPAYTISYGGKGATIRTRRWRYTRWEENIADGNEELYDHNNDPEEHHNLAGDPEYKASLEEMRNKFELARQKARTKIEIPGAAD
jgi:arylsulfatase A-like enzyme